MVVDLFDMKGVIDDLASKKVPWIGRNPAGYFKSAHFRLSASMSTLVSSIMVHGHLPQSLMNLL